MLAERLLIEEISGGPLASQLVVAVLPGRLMTVAGLLEPRPTCRCAEPTQTGCVVAWKTLGPQVCRE
ncbi:MAG: DUF3089 domain-containing protein [Deltaproteobacteria bacterium]|nr:DUF3089 domain-containing protein [Deltaproteobacteria bacterium]